MATYNRTILRDVPAAVRRGGYAASLQVSRHGAGYSFSQSRGGHLANCAASTSATQIDWHNEAALLKLVVRESAALHNPRPIKSAQRR